MAWSCKMSFTCGGAGLETEVSEESAGAAPAHFWQEYWDSLLLRPNHVLKQACTVALLAPA